MFLEMTDKSGNEIVVYSRNIFNPDENFSFIFNDQLQITRKRISYSDAFEFMAYPLPKNIILYRLLTNYENINSSDSKFGFVLHVNGIEDLFYFDPVYALKDLPHLVKDFNLETFKFRIQQAGLKTTRIEGTKEYFTEIYSYDLHAVEAQNQNDEIFAQALFEKVDRKNRVEPEPAADISDKEELHSEKVITEEPVENSVSENSTAFKPEEVKTDPDAIEVVFNKPQVDEEPKKPINKFEQKELLKKILGIDDIQIKGKGEFELKETNLDNFEFDGEKDFSRLFKSTSKMKDSADKDNDTITLRLTKF